MKRKMSTWNKKVISVIDFHLDLHELSKKIPRNQFEYIVGIPRGGNVISTYLSHFCEIPMVISVEEALRSINTTNILIVDDIADTGKTLENFFNLGFNIATLYHKPRSTVTPDFIGKTVENTDWIVFPWELDNEIPNRQV
jgi:hypoxanthine phosphoribosyltransferase